MTYQESAESAAEEIIEIEHGPDGTKINIDDPTGSELFAVVVIGVLILIGIWIWRQGRRA